MQIYIKTLTTQSFFVILTHNIPPTCHEYLFPTDVFRISIGMGWLSFIL